MFTFEQVRSLGGRTDLEILRGQGSRLTARSDYLVVETPGNPGYYWGNFLYFRRAPAPGDLARWETLFHHEFRLQPEVRHTTFGWDEPHAGERAPFEAAGYLYDPATALTLTAGQLRRPERAQPGLRVEALTGAEGWEAMVQNQLATRLAGFDLASYEPFKRRQARAYRTLSESGAGAWYGGFLEGRLVADCGLFFSGDTGRFQSVGTHPDFRRRGVCAALIHAVSARAFAEKPGATLVMAAATGEPAERIYRSVGYRATGSQHGLCRRPAEILAPA